MTFEDGTRAVYKPRPLQIETAFNDLVRDVNERLGCALQVVRVADAGPYGWAEFVEHGEDVADTTRFYEDVGLLTGLLYVLDGWDIHHENLLTHRGRPVVIDLETLLRPELVTPPSYGDGAAARLAADELGRSVCGIGTLPMIVGAGADSVGLDVGAIGYRNGQASPYKGFVLVNEGRDDLRIELAAQTAQGGPQNGVAEHVVPPEKMRDDVSRGLRRFLEFAIADRAFLHGRINAHFAHVRARHVHNATVFYSQLLRMATHPDYTADEVDRWVLMHRVSLRRMDGLDQVVAAEVADLCRGDVPYFSYDSDGLELLGSDGRPVGATFRRTPLASALAKLDALTQDQVERQIELLEMSFVAKLGSDRDETGFRLPDGPAPEDRAVDPEPTDRGGAAAGRRARRPDDRELVGAPAVHMAGPSGHHRREQPVGARRAGVRPVRRHHGDRGLPGGAGGGGGRPGGTVRDGRAQRPGPDVGPAAVGRLRRVPDLARRHDRPVGSGVVDPHGRSAARRRRPGRRRVRPAPDPAARHPQRHGARPRRRFGRRARRLPQPAPRRDHRRVPCRGPEHRRRGVRAAPHRAVPGPGHPTRTCTAASPTASPACCPSSSSSAR